jgi:hypothetical protein
MVSDYYLCNASRRIVLAGAFAFDGFNNLFTAG